MRVQCEAPFGASGTARSENAAMTKADQNASNFCQRTHPEDCPGAAEVGVGKFRHDGLGNITYITSYRCTIQP